MSNRFLTKNNAKNNDDDDLVQRQLSALEDVTEKTDLDVNDSIKTDAADTAGNGKDFETAQPTSAIEKKSVLQQDMVITGSITSVTALLIHGTVNGNVACESDVTVDGNIAGNVKAGNMQVLNGKIQGDIETKSAVTVFKGAIVNGNITGETLCCDGKIEGNTNVKGKAAINENAVIIGDIVCEKISIREGAVCKGNIQTDVAKTSSSANFDSAAAKSEGRANTQIGVVTDLKKYV